MRFSKEYASVVVQACEVFERCMPERHGLMRQWITSVAFGARVVGFSFSLWWAGSACVTGSMVELPEKCS